MDFIAMVKEKASELTVSAVKTSGMVAQTVKSNFAIADKEQEIKRVMREIGNMMYDAYKNGEEADAEKLAEKCILLDDYFAEIEDIKDKLNEIKNVVECPACGEKVKDNHNFCPKCGEKLADAE